MRHYLIAISIFIGIVPTLEAQGYRLQVGLYQDVVSNNYFDNVDGSHLIKHEINHVGLHCYYIDGFITKEAAETKKLELKSRDNRFLTAQVIGPTEVAACRAACAKKRATSPKEDSMYLTAILFKSGSTRVRSEGRRELRKIAAYLKKHPNHDLLLAGHTDSVGDPDFNMELAKDRVKSVRDSLGKRGIPAYRIHVNAHGESDPVAINFFDPELDSPESRAYNRRVDLTILDSMKEPIYSSAAAKEIPLEFQILEPKIQQKAEEVIMVQQKPPEFLDPEASLNASPDGAQ